MSGVRSATFAALVKRMSYRILESLLWDMSEDELLEVIHAVRAVRKRRAP